MSSRTKPTRNPLEEVEGLSLLRGGNHGILTRAEAVAEAERQNESEVVTEIESTVEQSLITLDGILDNEEVSPTLVRKPKIQQTRRVRKTWEISSTGLNELTEFAGQLERETGIKISEAYHVSIALQIYNLVRSRLPNLMDKIDDCLTGEETMAQAQDCVLQTLRKEILRLQYPK